MSKNLLAEIKGQEISIVISIVSIVIALVSLIQSCKSIKQSDAVIEIEVDNKIESSKTMLGETASVYNTLRTKKAKGVISSDEEIDLLVLQERYEACIESYLNAYEFACAEYLDNKIDRNRFKKNYQLALRQIMQKELFHKSLTRPDSNFKAIKKVYDKFENLEK